MHKVALGRVALTRLKAEAKAPAVWRFVVENLDIIPLLCILGLSSLCSAAFPRCLVALS